jgi:ATP-dependent Clp protease ATP-binding subunit ClpE
LKTTLAEQKITLSITDEAKEKIAELGYHPAFGARPLRRVIQEHVEDSIADILLEGTEITELVVEITDDEISVNNK